MRPQAQSAALLPLADGGVALGAIGLVFDRQRTFGPHDRDYLLTLTRLCGQALGRARRLPDRARPGLDAPAGAAAGVAAARGRARDRGPLPAGRGRGGGRRLLRRGRAARRAARDRGRRHRRPRRRRPPRRWASCAARCARTRSRGARRRGVLQLLSRYADGVTGARGATLVYAVVDPAAREVRYAAAGHPPPLLVAPNGRARYLEGARGVPLDRALGHVYEDAVAAVPEGTTLVLYSDGAIERRGEPLDVGLGAARGGRGGELAARARRALHAADRRAADRHAPPRRRRAGRGARARAGDRAAAAVVRGARRTSSRSCARRCGAGWRRRASTRATARWSCWRPASCARTPSSTPTRPGSDAAVEVALDPRPGRRADAGRARPRALAAAARRSGLARPRARRSCAR